MGRMVSNETNSMAMLVLYHANVSGIEAKQLCNAWGLTLTEARELRFLWLCRRANSQPQIDRLWNYADHQIDCERLWYLLEVAIEETGVPCGLLHYSRRC